MAKSVLDIIIKLSKQGGADKETVKGLVSLKSTIMGTAAVAGTLVAAGYAMNKVFNATAGEVVALADKVRRLQDATGASAEDSSRLIQILDDVKIGYDQLEKAVAKSGKTFDFSIDGIAKMSDEYLRLTDENDKAAFMTERFGKQWITFVPIMKQGGQAIREASDAVAKNLVLTQKSVNDAREYEIAVDNLSDAWMGLKITIGQELLPPFTALLNAQRDNMRVSELMGTSVWHSAGALSQAGIEARRLAASEREATDAALLQSDALDENSVSAEENAAALELVSDANKGLIDLIGKMQSAQESYGEKYQSISTDMNLSDDERKAKLAELAAEHDLDSKKIVLGLLEQRLMQDGLTTDELNFLLEKGLAWGIYSDTVIAESRAAMAEVDTLTARINNVPTQKTITFNVLAPSNLNFSNNPSPVGTQRRGYASGTDGWQKVPSGFPNDSFPIGLTSGETFAVNPKGGGGGNVNISLVISSPVTIMDEQNVKKVLLPYIIDGVRTAQAKGAIK